MNRVIVLMVAILLSSTNAFAQGLDSHYKLGPDSLEQDGVPHGKMSEAFTLPGWTK
jgi:hypothetical protein